MMNIPVAELVVCESQAAVRFGYMTAVVPAFSEKEWPVKFQKVMNELTWMKLIGIELIGIEIK